MIFFQDETFVNKLARQNKTVVQRLWNTLRNLWGKIKGVFSPKNYSVNMNEAGQSSGMTDAQFKNMEHMFEKALGNEVDSGVDGEVRYSVRSDNQGNTYVNIDGDILNGVPAKDRTATVKNVMKQKFGLPIQTESGDVTVNRTSRREYTGSQYTKNINNAMRVDKFRMANNIDEIIQNQQNVRSEIPKHSRKDNFVQFERGNIDVRVGNNDYTADVVVGITSSGKKIFYDVVNLNPIKIKDTASTHTGTTKAPIDFADTVSDINTITQNQDSVNSSISENSQNDTEKSSIKTSKFYDSTQNTDNLTQETKGAIAEQAEAFEYEGISNKETIQKALRGFQNNPLKTASEFLTTTPERARAKDIAAGFVLLQKYQEMGDFNSAVEVAKKHLQTWGKHWLILVRWVLQKDWL